MMRKFFISCVCFFPFLFSACFAETAGYGVQVRLNSFELQEIEPGKIASVSFLVSNRTESDEEFLQRLILPEGWQEIVPSDLSVKLKAEEEEVFIFAFLVPHTSPPGKYSVCYSIQSQSDYSITGSDSLSVAVLPVLKLELLAEDKPGMVVAGQAYEIGIRLINRGNSTTRIRLQAQSSLNYPIQIQPPEITLEAGSSRSVKIQIRTDEKLKQKTRQIVEIIAEPIEPADRGVSARQTVSADIIPRKTEETDHYRRLPLQMALIYAGKENRGGFQVEFSGSGRLDQTGKRRYDYLFWGPDIQNKSSWGKRDEFKISYWSKHYDFHIGDRSYLLSPLTEKQSYSRGVEANFRPGAAGFGVFFLENRWGEPKIRKMGTYLLYRFSDSFSLKGNFLAKGKEFSPSSRDWCVKVYSLEAGFNPGDQLHSNIECGYSSDEKDHRSDDLAFRMDLDGRVASNIRYSLEKTYAGSDYFGYYNDLDYVSSSLSFPIYRKLKGDLSYRSYKNNLEVDSTGGIANREKNYQMNLSYLFPFGTEITLDYKNLSRRDDVLPVDYDYEEKTLKLGFLQTKGKFSLSTHMERGRFEDHLEGIQSDRLERYDLYVNFHPNYRQAYNLYTRIGQSSFSGHPERTKSIGISGAWHIKANISFDLNYRWDKYDSGNSPSRNNVLSSLSYALPFHHLLILRSQWTQSRPSGRGDFSFLVMYNLPLKIPWSKKRGMALLKGKVYYADRTNQPPIPRVILTTGGATAITDDNGEFVFPELEAGRHYLQVDSRSIGFNQVTGERLPWMIELRGGEEKEIKLEVLTSGRIYGRLEILAPNPEKKTEDQPVDSSDNRFWVSPDEGTGSGKQELETKEGLANTLVEITNGKEFLQQITDQKGRFSFDGLRPGKWIIKINNQNLPTHYYLEQEEFQVELSSGEQKEVKARVLPRIRPIQMIEEGEIKNK